MKEFFEGGWVVWAFLLCVCWAIYGFLPETLKYSIAQGVPRESVTMTAEKPHDCEFMTAPIGEKRCKYEISAAMVRTAISTEGKPIVSFDEGNTWVFNDGVPPLKPSATLTWKRVNE